MRTGKLSISRGHEIEGRSEPPSLSLVPPAPTPAPSSHTRLVSPEYGLVHDRLTALERLAGLRENKVISSDEFAREKAIVLGLPADELLLCAAERPPEPVHPRLRSSHRPSLVGRLLSWKFLPVGLAAGLALSFASQPQETMRFFDEALRLVGA